MCSSGRPPSIKTERWIRDKSEVLRVLIDVMAEDAALRSEVHERLRAG